MKIQNMSVGTITIAGVYSIPAGETRHFEDGMWSTLRERPAVKQWMAESKLIELPDVIPVSASTPETAPVGPPEPAVSAGEAAASGEAAQPSEAASEVATAPHPLDHDGDGKKGGSKPKGKTR